MFSVDSLSKRLRYPMRFSPVAFLRLQARHAKKLVNRLLRIRRLQLFGVVILVLHVNVGIRAIVIVLIIEVVPMKRLASCRS